MNRFVLVAANARDVDALRARGLRCRVIAPDLAGDTFYTAHTSGTAGRGIVERHARLLYGGETDVVVAATEEQAVALSAEGIEIARVFTTPARMRLRTAIRQPIAAPLSPDPVVAAMVNSVSSARIDARIQRLQDFETRHATSDSCLAAAEYIRDEFVSYGLETVYFDEWLTNFGPNVVAVLPGKTDPDRIVIVGGHYDSMSRDSEAPGADDNASGTSGVLECARIMAAQEFVHTVLFVAFCGEEFGLLGSESMASEAAARGDDIVAMINMDMIGYVMPGDDEDIDIIANASSEWLRELVLAAGSLYVPGFGVVAGTSQYASSSDHASYWRHGYSAVFFFEDGDLISPYIHSHNDLIGLSYISPSLARGSVQVALATAATAAVPFRVTGIGATPPPGLPALEPNYPNPFNPGTVIPVVVGAPGEVVTLRVYDAAGRAVATLLNSEMVTGRRGVVWDGRDRSGRPVSSGVYFCRLEAAGGSVVRKLVVVR